MVIKKKITSNSNTKAVKNANEDRNNSFDSKSAADEQTIDASSGNLRVTGANLPGIPETASVTIQCTISEDNYEAKSSDEPAVPTASKTVESDTDGFVVRRLLTGTQEADSTWTPPQNTLIDPAALFYSNPAVRPPPTAPRSSPTNDPLSLSYKDYFNKTHSYDSMGTLMRSNKDVSLPRLPATKKTEASQDVYQLRATTSPPANRFPGLSQDNFSGKPGHMIPARPDTEMSHAGLPPYFVRSTLEDVERLPAIHPSILASRGERRVEYRGFVSAPPLSTSPPGTAAARRSPTKLNAIPLKRASAVKKAEEVANECWRCALKLEHSKCETAKYIRIGGGFRHSYWFVRQLIEKAKKEEGKQLELIKREHRTIFSEKLAWRVGKDGKRERRIKTFVRTSSGRRVAKYQYVAEDVYEEMMELNRAGARASESAKRRLKQKLAQSMGLSEEDADMLDTWDAQSVGADEVAVDEEGNPLLDEYGDPISLDDPTKIERAIRRNRRKKEGYDRDSEEESDRADSGLAFSDNEERERRRRYRRGDRSDSESSRRHRKSDRDSEGSGVGRRHRGARKGSRGADSDFSADNILDGTRRQRQKKDGHGSGGSDIESAYGSHKGGRKKKGGKKGDGGYSDDNDDDEATGGKKKGRRNKRGSRAGSDDSFDSSDPKKKGKRGRGKKKGDYDDDDESDHSGSRRRGKGRRKGRKGSRGGSRSDSYDSDGGKRRTRKGKKKGGRHGDDESGSESDNRDGGRRKKKKGRKGRHGSGSDTDRSDYSDDRGKSHKNRHRRKKGGAGDDESDGSYTDEGRGNRRKKDRRRGRHGSYSDEYSGDEDDGRKKSRRRRDRRRDGSRHSSVSGDSYDGDRRRGGRRHRRRGRRDDDDYSDRSSSNGSGRRRHHRRKDRHRRRKDGSSDGSFRSDESDRSRHRSRRRRHRRRDGDHASEDESYSSGSDDGRRRRRKKDRRRRGRRRSSYSDEYSGSGSDDDGGGRKRKGKKKGSRHRRRHRKDGDYSDEDYSDYSADSGDSYDDQKRRRRRKKDKHRRRNRRHSSDDDYSGDDYSDDSRRSRRRRRRHRRRSYSYSDESGSVDSGAESRRGKKKRHRRRRRHSSDYSDESSQSRSRDRRRRRRHRRRDRSDSEYSDEDSGRSRSRRRHRRKHKGRHRDSDYSDSGSSRSRSRHRRRRRRRRHYDSDSDEDSGRSRDRHRRRRRHRRRHSDSSSDYSSSDDSRPRRRHRRRHRRYSDDSDTSGSDSYDDRRRRRDKKHRRHRRYSTSTEESSAGDEKPSRRKDKHRRRRQRYDSSDDSSSYDSYDRRGKKKKKKPPRPPSTDSSSLSSEASEGRLAVMSKKERKAYEKRRRDKEERKEKRQHMREEYDRYIEKREKKKERRKNREDRGSLSSSSDDDSFGDGKTAVKYDRGARRKIMDKSRKSDGRDIGYDDPNDPWRKKDKRRDKKKKDRTKGEGDSSDSDDLSSEIDPSDPLRTKKKKEKARKKKGKGGDISSSDESDAQSIYEDVFGDDGTIQRRKIKVQKKKKGSEMRTYDDDELDAESEYDSVGSADVDKLIARQIYDKDGEVIRLTKDGRRIKDGKISKEVFDIEKHQQKKKKQKREKQMMEKSYEEEYVEEFIDEEGNVVKVVKKRLKEKTTVPGRRPATPLTGPRRVQVLFLRGGKHLQDRLDQLLAECPLNDPRALISLDGARALDLDERDGSVDYLTHYSLVKPSNLEVYGKAFLVEDTDEDNVISLNEARVALEGIPALQGLNDKQVNYILKVLGIDDATIVTFKMFAVVAALCERLLSVMDEHMKQWVEINDLADMERKIALYRSMFYWNTCSDRSSNYIKTTSLRIELIAGGLNRVQEEYVIEKIEPNIYREVSFIDYMAFIPLFLSTHESIIDNPLDMSRDKFNDSKVMVPQRDLVPLGRPMTVSAVTDMESHPIPYEFHFRPGSSGRKRIRLVSPKPKIATPDSNDNTSLSGSKRDSFSPLPPKVSKRRTMFAGTR